MKPRALGLRETLMLQLCNLMQSSETLIFTAQKLTLSPKATMALHR